MEGTYLATLPNEVRQEISKYIRNNIQATYCRACLRKVLNLERLSGQLKLLPPVNLDVCFCWNGPGKWLPMYTEEPDSYY